MFLSDDCDQTSKAVIGSTRPLPDDVDDDVYRYAYDLWRLQDIAPMHGPPTRALLESETRHWHDASKTLLVAEV